MKTITTDEHMLIEALNHLRRAIDLLDDAGAPAQIAAHVDLAASQLADLIPEIGVGSEIAARGKAHGRTIGRR